MYDAIIRRRAAMAPTPLNEPMAPLEPDAVDTVDAPSDDVASLARKKLSVKMMGAGHGERGTVRSGSTGIV